VWYSADYHKEATPRHRLIATVYSPNMAPKKTTLKEIGQILAYVVKHMATKDDIAGLRREMATKDDITRLDNKLTKFEEHEPPSWGWNPGTGRDPAPRHSKPSKKGGNFPARHVHRRSAFRVELLRLKSYAKKISASGSLLFE
jgi:hypothetical protein